MRYKQKFFEYVEFRCGNCNKKLIREFVSFLEEEGYELRESAEAIPLFTETEWFSNRTKSTKQNYMRDLKRFAEYVYSSEDEALYPEFVRQQYKWDGMEKLERIKKRMIKQEQQDKDQSVVEDEDYKAFLMKYEKLTEEEE